MTPLIVHIWSGWKCTPQWWPAASEFNVLWVTDLSPPRPLPLVAIRTRFPQHSESVFPEKIMVTL